MPAPSIQRILFVCDGNTCRSPMAEAIARQLLGRRAHVASAGINVADGAAITRNAINTMQERGIDVRDHRSRHLGSFNLADFDLVVAMTARIAAEVRRLGVDASKIESLDIRDPYGQDLAIYRETAEDIDLEIRRLLELSPRTPEEQ